MEETVKDTCLYMHTRKSDGRIFYIGIGSKKRPYQKRDRNSHWQNTVKLHGRNVTILVENLTWERACELETIMISFYGRADLGLGPLVNWTSGGEGAKNPSEATRKKISDRTKGENNPMFGKYGELNPMFGKCGELHPSYGVDRPDHSRKMTGEGNPMYGVGVYESWVQKYGKEEADKRNEDANQKRRDKLKGNKNQKTRKVVCILTGEIYGSVTEVANNIGMKVGTLYNKLSGVNKNNTTYKFL